MSASSQIKDAINLLASSLNEYAGMLTLTPEEQALLNSILPLLENIKSLLENDLGTAVFLPIAQALKKEAVLAAFPDLDLTNPQIQDLLNYMEIQASAIEDAYNMLAPYQSTIIDELLPKIDPIIKLLNGIGQISQLIDGVNELNNQYGLFHEGLVGLSNGLAQLESSSGELVAGGEQLQDGLSQLNKGASDFASGLDQYSGGVSQLSEGANQLSAGTSQLNKETKNIDSLMEERIKELMEDYEFEDFEMVSFVDEKNVNIKLVQFVFMSQPISKPVAEEEVITKEKPKSFFELFLDLFRK